LERCRLILTTDVGQYYPLDEGGLGAPLRVDDSGVVEEQRLGQHDCKTINTSLAPSDTLTQKREVRGGMTDELDEGLPHGLADDGMWGEDVADREEREQDADPDDLESLQDHVFPAEAGKALVPDRRQQLLDVGMGDELQHKDGIGYRMRCMQITCSLKSLVIGGAWLRSG
jgi:hypothetical protein